MWAAQSVDIFNFQDLLIYKFIFIFWILYVLRTFILISWWVFFFTLFRIHYPFPPCQMVHYTSLLVTWIPLGKYLSIQRPPQQHLPHGFLILSNCTLSPDTLSTSNHSMTVSAWYWPGSQVPRTVTQVIRYSYIYCMYTFKATPAHKNMFNDLQDCRLCSSWVHTGFSLGAVVAGPSTFFWLDCCPAVLSAPPLNHRLPNSSTRQGHPSNPRGPPTPVLPTASHMNHEAYRRHIIWYPNI